MKCEDDIKIAVEKRSHIPENPAWGLRVKERKEWAEISSVREFSKDRLISGRDHVVQIWLAFEREEEAKRLFQELCLADCISKKWKWEGGASQIILKETLWKWKLNAWHLGKTERIAVGVAGETGLLWLLSLHLIHWNDENLQEMEFTSIEKSWSNLKFCFLGEDDLGV